LDTDEKIMKKLWRTRTLWIARIAIVLVVVIVASLYAPFGYATTVPITVGKMTGGICCEPGCWDPATETVEYSGGSKLRFCDAHAQTAPETIVDGSNNSIFFGTFFSFFAYLPLVIYLSDVDPNDSSYKHVARDLFLCLIVPIISMLILWVTVLFF
jgi:hypothetical protein